RIPVSLHIRRRDSLLHAVESRGHAERRNRTEDVAAAEVERQYGVLSGKRDVVVFASYLQVMSRREVAHGLYELEMPIAPEVRRDAVATDARDAHPLAPRDT